VTDYVIKRNNVKRHGTGGPTIVLGHGFGVNQLVWRKVVSALSDYQTITFDYVGCGKSDRSAYDENRYSSLHGYAKDIFDICDVLHLSDVTFIGHSVSCMIGLIAGIERPEMFSRFIFVAPTPRFLNDPTDHYKGGFEMNDLQAMMSMIDHNYFEWVSQAIPDIVNNPEQPEMVREIVEMFRTADQKIMKQFALATFFSDHRKQLLEFRKPCLILQARQDPIAPPEVGDYMNAHLEKSKLKVLKGKGHFPQLTSGDEVIREIRQYLTST
jgi:sigma-B regulation protein RsbQ